MGLGFGDNKKGTLFLNPGLGLVVLNGNQQKNLRTGRDEPPAQSPSFWALRSRFVLGFCFGFGKV